MNFAHNDAELQQEMMENKRIDFLQKMRDVFVVIETCQICNKTPLMQAVSHSLHLKSKVGQLVVNGLAQEDLPLASKLYLQSLFCQGNKLLFRQTV